MSSFQEWARGDEGRDPEDEEQSQGEEEDLSRSMLKQRPTRLTQPEADKREIRAFYVFDWANSVYATVVVGGYLPLLLQSLALTEAGYPDNCPNLITNQSMVPLQSNLWGGVSVGPLMRKRGV